MKLMQKTALSLIFAAAAMVPVVAATPASALSFAQRVSIANTGSHAARRERMYKQIEQERVVLSIIADPSKTMEDVATCVYSSNFPDFDARDVAYLYEARCEVLGDEMRMANSVEAQAIKQIMHQKNMENVGIHVMAAICNPDKTADDIKKAADGYSLEFSGVSVSPYAYSYIQEARENFLSDINQKPTPEQAIEMIKFMKQKEDAFVMKAVMAVGAFVVVGGAVSGATQEKRNKSWF